MRIDFDPCFEMMDKMGALSRAILGTAGEKFFTQLMEGHPVREMRASFNERSIRRELRVGVTCIIVDYQNFEGIPLDKIRDNSDFATLMSVVTAIRSMFHIERELRTGLRLYYLNTLAQERSHVVNGFHSLISNSMNAPVAKALGTPTDYGIAYSGGDEGSLQYTMRFGPFLGPAESPKYFENVAADASQKLLESADFICDLDQFQVKTAFGHQLMWWKQPLLSASNLVPQLEKQIYSAIPSSDKL